MAGIVAIGGGQASFSFIQKLKALGYSGEITLICGEKAIPYQRPPLSKKFLLGDMTKEQLFFRPESYYRDNKINLVIGKKVVKVNTNKKSIELEDGFNLPYDKLFFGTGASPRKFSDEMVNKTKSIYYIRSIKDIESVSKHFVSNRSLVIIGGGYIGLEVAAVARKLGLKVTIFEVQERILKRVASNKVADYFRDLHTKNGINIKENVSVERFVFEGNNLKAVFTDQGESISTDFVVAGIGIEPNVYLAKNAGLLVQNGILVDSSCCTSDPNIFAAGDCANFPYKGQRIRLESVGNAIEQSEVAAETILGKVSIYEALPWFWSDQFNTKLQIAGLNFGYTDVVERINGEKISFWYFKEGNLLSVDAINDPISFMVGKKLIEMKKVINPRDLRSENFNLKGLLRG